MFQLIIAKVYDKFRSLALVKVTTVINCICIKTMNNNNTAGLSIICNKPVNKHYARYCNNYFHFEKRVINFQLF